MLWDQLNKRNNRHIQLRPLDSISLQGHKYAESNLEGAWIKLRFSLEEDELNQGQIEELARKLPKAFRKAKIPLRRIDWIKMESGNAHRRPTIEGGVTAVNLARKWRQMSQSTRHGPRPNQDISSESLSPGQQRQAEPLPSSKRKRLDPLLHTDGAPSMGTISVGSMTTCASPASMVDEENCFMSE
jgi:hypothetical protein